MLPGHMEITGQFMFVYQVVLNYLYRVWGLAAVVVAPVCNLNRTDWTLFRAERIPVFSSCVIEALSALWCVVTTHDMLFIVYVK